MPPPLRTQEGGRAKFSRKETDPVFATTFQGGQLEVRRDSWVRLRRAANVFQGETVGDREGGGQLGAPRKRQMFSRGKHLEAGGGTVKVLDR